MAITAPQSFKTVFSASSNLVVSGDRRGEMRFWETRLVTVVIVCFLEHLFINWECVAPATSRAQRSCVNTRAGSATLRVRSTVRGCSGVVTIVFACMRRNVHCFGFERTLERFRGSRWNNAPLAGTPRRQSRTGAGE